MDDESIIITNGFDFRIEAAELLIDGEATIRSFPVSPLPTAEERPRLRASPSFDPGPNTEGGGRSGGGATGTVPVEGVDGQLGGDAGAITIRVSDRAEGILRILNRGQSGTDGSSGSHGVGGGHGEQGTRSRTEIIETWFGDVCYCDAGPGFGGNGGAGANGGRAGKAGDGGDSGPVEIAVQGDATDFSILRVDIRGGRIGEVGLPGDAGPAGSGGYGGRGSCGCSGRIDERKGQPGVTGVKGSEAGDRTAEEGAAGTFSPVGAPYVFTIIDSDPVSNCQQSNGDPAQFWPTFLKAFSLCSNSKAVGSAILCETDPTNQSLQKLLLLVDQLSQTPPNGRPFGAPCVGSSLFERLGCIAGTLPSKRPLLSDITKIDPQGSEELSAENVDKVVRFFLLSLAAHVLADEAVHLPIDAASAPFTKNQLVVTWHSSTSDLLIPINERTLENLGLLASAYESWRHGYPQATLIVTPESLAFQPSSGDVSQEIYRDSFAVAGESSLMGAVPGDGYKFAIRFVMMGDGRAALVPLTAFAPGPYPDDSVAFCRWLSKQGGLLDDGMLRAFRFDAFGKGTTEAILATRGTLSGRNPSALFANLLYLLAAWGVPSS